MEGRTMEGHLVDGLEWQTQNKTLQVISKNPYGFMHFRFKEGGALPQELSGAYTNVSDVEAAGNKYISSVFISSNAHKERPVLKTKKVSTKVKEEE
tara:strand:- start:248 stop:535 length:288 start_codon:yes stop_codon:yes gene_type:complete